MLNVEVLNIYMSVLRYQNTAVAIYDKGIKQVNLEKVLKNAVANIKNQNLLIQVLNMFVSDDNNRALTPITRFSQCFYSDVVENTI